MLEAGLQQYTFSSQKKKAKKVSLFDNQKVSKQLKDNKFILAIGKVLTIKMRDLRNMNMIVLTSLNLITNKHIYHGVE